MKLALLVVVVACSGPAAPQAPRPSPPGEAPVSDPPAPTFRLPTHFTPERYRASLSVDPAKPTFTGTIGIVGTLARPAQTVWVNAKDLAIATATAVRGTDRIALVATQQPNDLLQLRAAKPLSPGEWTLELAYTGKLATDDKAGAFLSSYEKDPYILTQFETHYARRVFPCFDEPDRKVPWELTLDIPKGLVAVSNGVGTPSEINGRTRIAFAPTRPLPTYLITFAVGPFQVIDAGRTKSQVPIRIITPRGTEARAGFVSQATPKLVELLEGWFGMNYPYPKLDIIVAPSFGDAMENAGAILADPAFALTEDKPSWIARHRVTQVIGHEIAHQWFGDLVTPAWWDDLWLNEAFATWMENYIGAWFEPAWRDEDQFVSVRTSALQSDRLTTAKRVREPVLDTPGIVNAPDGITYQKGSSVLRMIERHVGPEVFQRGVRAYLKKHADGVARGADLIQAISEASGKPLQPIFDSFLDQAGAPELTLKVACDRSPRVEITQVRSVAPGTTVDGRSWTIPVCLVHDRDGKRATTCGVIDQTVKSIALDRCPTWVMGNANGDGYYNIAITTKELEVLRDKAWAMLTTLEQRVVLEDARRRTLDGKVEFATMMSLWARLAASDDKLAVADALGGTGRQSTLSPMTGLPTGVDSVLPATRVAAAQNKINAVIGPRVAKLGLVPRTDDDFNREVLRAALLGAAVHGRDPSLSRDAVKLAATYKTLPGSIRREVMVIAADANGAVADRLYADAMTEADATLRREMLQALAAVRDPVRRTKHLDLVLHPKADLFDQFSLLGIAVDTATSAAQEAWLRARWPDLETHLTGDAVLARYLGWTVIANCDGARRADTVALITKIGAKSTDGGLQLKQQIETLDQCIAQRALLAPSIEAWLRK